GQQAGQQAHAGAGIAAVQCLRAGTQAMQAHAVHHALAVGRRVDAHAELLQHGGGGAGVLAFEETADMRHPVGQRAEHQRAVRDGLVARHAHASTQRAGRAAAPVHAPAHSCATDCSISFTAACNASSWMWPETSMKNAYCHLPLCAGRDSMRLRLTPCAANGLSTWYSAPGWSFTVINSEVRSLPEGGNRLRPITRKR